VKVYVEMSATLMLPIVIVRFGSANMYVIQLTAGEIVTDIGVQVNKP